MNDQNARNTIYLGTSNVGKYTEAKIRQNKIHVSRYNLCVTVPGFLNQKTFVNVNFFFYKHQLQRGLCAWRQHLKCYYILLLGHILLGGVFRGRGKNRLNGRRGNKWRLGESWPGLEDDCGGLCIYHVTQ